MHGVGGALIGLLVRVGGLGQSPGEALQLLLKHCEALFRIAKIVLVCGLEGQRARLLTPLSGGGLTGAES